MAQVALSLEPPETPPPIPLRSHLRNDSAFQLKLYAIKSNTVNMAGTPSSAASQALLEDIDCKPADTPKKLHDPVSQKMDNKRGPALREDWKISNIRSQNKVSHSGGEEGGSGVLCKSSAGVGAGLPDDPQEPLHVAPLIPQLVFSCEHDQEAREDHSKIESEAVGVSKHTATQSGRLHTTSSTATKTGLGLTSNSLQSSQYQPKTTDKKVSDWLTYGLLDSPPPEAGFLTRISGSSDRSFAARHVPLSLFPPISSSSDVREYMPRNASSIRSACPVSPLNNGRDAYGNHIPSNARDCFTAHSRPSFLKPLTINDERTTVSSEKPSSTRPLYDFHWDRFKSFWKAAGTQAGSQRTDPHYPHIIPDQDTLLWDVPEVSYPGRVGDHGLHSIRLPSPAAYSKSDSRAIDNMKYGCSVPNLGRDRLQDVDLSREGPKRVGTGETARSKNRFNVKHSQGNTSRYEKTWHSGNLSSPEGSMQVERYDINMATLPTDDRTVEPGDGLSHAYQKVDNQPKTRPTGETKQSHERAVFDTRKQLTCQKKTQKQAQNVMCDDVNTAAITSLPARGAFTLERMLDFSIKLPRKSTSSSQNFPAQDPIPVAPQDPEKQKQNIATPGHAAMAPLASAPAVSSNTEKSQPLLRTMLSKAGNITRSILTVTIDPKLKASSQRQPSTDSSRTSRPQFSMSADWNGYPQLNPSNTQEEANTLASHYQILTAGAFDNPPPNEHNRHASLASVTNEALLIADQLVQRDARWSTDQVQSSFSSDSTSEIVPQQPCNKEKKGEVAKVMTWMGLHE